MARRRRLICFSAKDARSGAGWGRASVVVVIAVGLLTGKTVSHADIAPPPSPPVRPAAAAPATSPARATAAPVVRPASTPSLFLVDTHADITQRLVYDKGDFVAGIEGSHLDLPKARAGQLGAEFFSIFVYPKRTPREHWFDEAEHQMKALREMAASSGGRVVVATTADEVRAAQARGALAMLFGVEGGHMLGPGTPEDTQLDHLRRLHALGARYLTLTWAVSNDLGGSSGDDGDGTGLTPFGRKVMAEMERLGMMIDLSHVSDPLFWDALRAARRPVLLSHSSSRALANVPRNLTDAMARAVAKNGGAICVNFNPSFLDADYAHRQAPLWAAAKSLNVEQASRYMAAESKKLPPVPLAKLVEHVVHLVEVAGPDHVCLGSDFDGIPSLPAGLESAADLPKLVALLAEKLEPRTLAKITSENVLRVLAANEAPHSPVRQP